jgi:Zn finger protein HypA/HybF involved in hydrogenase expression
MSGTPIISTDEGLECVDCKYAFDHGETLVISDEGFILCPKCYANRLKKDHGHI